MSYVASLSYGKDSLKMLDVIKTRGLPLDRIITFDVWATDFISADLPEVSEFKKRMDFYIRDKYGIDVEHLCAKDENGNKITYESCFYRVFESGKNKDRIYGFPFLLGAWCNDRLKIGARVGAIKSDDIVYVGIAYDGRKRYKIINDFIVAPLVSFRIDEDLCGLHCKCEGILSPSYENCYRDGCWFCHNQGIIQLRNLRKNYPQLWELLLKWDIDSPIPFKANGHTVADFDKRFALEDIGAVPLDLSFRWSMLNEPRQLSFIF